MHLLILNTNVQRTGIILVRKNDRSTNDIHRTKIDGGTMGDQKIIHIPIGGRNDLLYRTPDDYSCICTDLHKDST